MLIYELNCESGHAFEGWFDSLEQMQTQLDENRISCPVCGSVKVRQVPCAFAISKNAVYQPACDTPTVDEQQAAKVFEQALQHFFANNFEDVGTNFCSEALKIHYQAAPMRNIRGISSAQEEEVLRREGVDFFKFSEHNQPGKPDKLNH